MKIKLNFNKTLEENAGLYFEKAKKARKKLEGAKKALELSKQSIADSQKQKSKPAREKKPAKKEWFDDFRWFISSDGFLVIGGRDAETNDIIVRKHLEKDDLVFHTELPGSPFAVVKAEKKTIPEKTMVEAAEFCASFSRAWKQGFATSDVYQIKPEQVKKELGLPKGTFMIYGDRKYYRPALTVGLGLYNGKVMAGPVFAVKKHCKEFVELGQGGEKPSDIAKSIRKKLGAELDEIIKALPAGSFRLKK
ncbi:MAG: NFACT RNA binding domain-containing protein [Candidatus Woesearchaeota archaeon]